MEVRMNLKTTLALALAVTFAASVLAQPADRVPEAKDAPSAGASAEGFAAMDRNKDGYLSRDEARDAVWNSRFSEVDTDNDERLSEREFNTLESTASGAAAGATERKEKR
jgi:2-methylcitrate dehydratase PrpD